MPSRTIIILSSVSAFTARKAEAEAHRVSQLAKIEEDRIQAERAIAAAQLAGEEVRRALTPKTARCHLRPCPFTPPLLTRPPFLPRYRYSARAGTSRGGGGAPRAHPGV